jgi:hypothetical protein
MFSRVFLGNEDWKDKKIPLNKEVSSGGSRLIAVLRGLNYSKTIRLKVDSSTGPCSHASWCMKKSPSLLDPSVP